MNIGQNPPKKESGLPTTIFSEVTLFLGRFFFGT